jgi:hypothetical protein
MGSVWRCILVVRLLLLSTNEAVNCRGVEVHVAREIIITIIITVVCGGAYWS